MKRSHLFHENDHDHVDKDGTKYDAKNFTKNGLKFKPNTNWRKLNAIQGNISTSDFIKEWVKANPATSVQLGWLDNPPTLPELMSSHGKVTKEIIDVFTYKQ